jgi:hypothetical protein
VSILSTDKIKLLEKFGFIIEETGFFLHKKLDVILNKEQVIQLALDDLENYIRKSLRSS